MASRWWRNNLINWDMANKPLYLNWIDYWRMFDSFFCLIQCIWRVLDPRPGCRVLNSLYSRGSEVRFRTGMEISGYFCFMGREDVHQSKKMVLRKSRNENWMLIMIRVIPPSQHGVAAVVEVRIRSTFTVDHLVKTCVGPGLVLVQVDTGFRQGTGSWFFRV